MIWLILILVGAGAYFLFGAGKFKLPTSQEPKDIESITALVEQFAQKMCAEISTIPGLSSEIIFLGKFGEDGGLYPSILFSDSNKDNNHGIFQRQGIGNVLICNGNEKKIEIKFSIYDFKYENENLIILDQKIIDKSDFKVLGQSGNNGFIFDKCTLHVQKPSFYIKDFQGNILDEISIKEISGPNGTYNNLKGGNWEREFAYRSTSHFISPTRGYWTELLHSYTNPNDEDRAFEHSITLIFDLKNKKLFRNYTSDQQDKILTINFVENGTDSGGLIYFIRNSFQGELYRFGFGIPKEVGEYGQFSSETEFINLGSITDTDGDVKMYNSFFGFNSERKQFCAVFAGEKCHFVSKSTNNAPPIIISPKSLVAKPMWAHSSRLHKLSDASFTLTLEVSYDLPPSNKSQHRDSIRFVIVTKHQF